MLQHIGYYMGSLDNANTKTYFDIATYRNVLTIINTLDKLRVRYESNLSAQVINAERALKVSFGWGWRPVTVPATTGYVIQKSGDTSPTAPFTYMKNLAAQSGLSPPTTGYFNKGDLLSVARSLQYEMNRLRLPLPFNYIQLLDKIQNLVSDIPNPERYECGSDVTEDCYRNLNLTNFVALLKAIESIPQLRAATILIKNAVRKEIDAANLASKVQEETLRREQAELITRQAAKDEAEKRKVIILEEKKIALQKEFDEAEKLKQTMADQKAKLLQEKAKLDADKAAAQTQAEAEQIKQQQLNVNNNIQRVDDIVRDKAAALVTARTAAKNVGGEIQMIAEQQKQAQLQTQPKKSINIKTVLLTVAAGAMFL